MTCSVTEVTCTNCENRFCGFLNDLFNVSKQYAATCPECEKQTFFAGKVAIIDIAVPKDAVQIMYVEQL